MPERIVEETLFLGREERADFFLGVRKKRLSECAQFPAQLGIVTNATEKSLTKKAEFAETVGTAKSKGQKKKRRECGLQKLVLRDPES
jgi:hypothetical protein